MTRPFAYNPSNIPISGASQMGDLAVGVINQEYSLDPGLVKWWMGPDETTGYIICAPVSTGDYPTPIGNIGTVHFWRSESLTDDSFLTLVSYLSNGVVTTINDIQNWLNINGYWSSWNGGGFTYTQLSGGIGQYSQGVSLCGSSPVIGGSGSYSFNGAKGFIEIYPNVVDTVFGTGDYTIEWFYYELSQNLHPRFFSIGHYPSSTMDCSVEANLWWFGENGGWVSGGPNIGGDLTGQWHHFAIVRINNFTSMYKDANLITSFADNNNLIDSTTPLIISQDNLLNDPACYINGLISNFRWVKGLGVYTQAGFTVPTGDLTEIALANPYGGNYTEAVGIGYTKFLLIGGV